jgi:hypothetical protein
VHARFRIALANASTPDLVHELRNFGEYVLRAVGDKVILDMNQVDSATEFFLVEVTHKRHLGEVMAALRRGTRPTVPDSHFILERL